METFRRQRRTLRLVPRQRLLVAIRVCFDVKSSIARCWRSSSPCALLMHIHILPLLGAKREHRTNPAAARRRASLRAGRARRIRKTRSRGGEGTCCFDVRSIPGVWDPRASQVLPTTSPKSQPGETLASCPTPGRDAPLSFVPSLRVLLYLVIILPSGSLSHTRHFKTFHMT